MPNSVLQVFAGQRRFKAANGIVYRTFGEGRPLILIHGSSGSWMHWHRNIEALAKSHRVIALDLPGYGESVVVPPDVSLDAYVDLVERAALEASDGVVQIDVVAFSFGGLIGASLTARLGAQARRTVLLAPSGFPKPVNRQLGRRPRSSFPEGAKGEQDYLRHNLLAMMLHDPAAVDNDALEIHRWNMAHSRFDNRRLIEGNQLPGILAKIKCPLLVAYGGQDRTPVPSIEGRLAICRDIVPDMESKIIPAAGHWVQFEQPKETNAMIKKFLDE